MTNASNYHCPVCNLPDTIFFKTISNYSFFECLGCLSLFLDPTVIDRIDAGESLVRYEAAYWDEELKAAWNRSYGPALARLAEAILYARRDIDVFLDVGSGPGYLLDACQLHLPTSSHKFYGVELFPPERSRTNHPNYFIGSVSDLPLKVDAGCCIEVIEHLTPKMVNTLLMGLSRISQPSALFIFNSGQPSYVKLEDPGYLDPVGRGHIISYSVAGFNVMAQRHGFHARALPGKGWAFVLEKDQETTDPLLDRIWNASPCNRSILNDPVTGSLMYIVGLETARAYN